MKQLKKLILINLTIIMILLMSQQVFANNITDSLTKVEYTDEFKKWLQLTDEEKENVIQPRMYEVPYSKPKSENPLYIAKMLKANSSSRFSLKEIIPNNLSIRNQQQTNSCWAFAALSSLETNLALSNYKKGTNLSKVYDFSERHMEYATSKTFANNVENTIGYNRQVGSGGTFYIASSYLTNGSGAIPESEMPFENNENIIEINQIQNKTISSQVYDTVNFPDYRYKTAVEKSEIMNQIKQHIQNYGSVQAAIHGNSSNLSAFGCYNNDTGAKFCNSSIMHSLDHAVSIIGWDDNYSIDNFPEAAKPESNGAWIVRNSWGEKAEDWQLSDLKNAIFNEFEQQCISRGWDSAQDIPNAFIEQLGYTIENNMAYIKYGDNGIIYISYEDVNVSKQMFGIVRATDILSYNNIYQYDEFFPAMELSLTSKEVMLCNVFDKKTTEPEYLTQISLFAPETYTCKVYVNPNGPTREKNHLQPVELKAGQSETVNAGYHTLEFSEPIEIKANSFAVVVEIQSAGSSTRIPLESVVAEVPDWNSVKVEEGKCFVAMGSKLENCQWLDLGKLKEQKSTLVNGDSSIKAFTTNKLIDESLKNIEIVTPPTKTSYFEGENFDKAGMVIKANYNSETNPSVILDSSNYSITNGTNLQDGQTSVTITYEDKSVEQPITVEKNIITNLTITTPPTKTEYKEGQNFDKTGMVIEATYKKGNTEIVTNYTIENGNNLQNGQTDVTISYEGETVKQAITVIPNPLIEIRIDKAPNKTKYVVGQNFDKTGMIVLGVFQDETTVEIVDYVIQNGTNLTKGQTTITVEYQSKTAIQAITVEEKSITEITIKEKPSKLTYIQNKEELDLTGGILTITYNDETTEDISMTSEELTVAGFSNEEIGKKVITLTYQSKTVNLEVEIVAELVAENSKMDNLAGNVKKIKAYYFTDDPQKDYTLMEIEINNIIKNLDNDNLEYYYYLSTSKSETNINDWVKISEKQELSDKLQFTIDTRNISNYEDISNENDLYLYIKEVAIKGGNQSIKVSNAISLESDVEIETYVDNAKKENINFNNEPKSDTSAKGIIPDTGKSIYIIVFGILILSVISMITYKKIKYLNFK